MSGVFWCCCGVTAEPNPCPCNCVCTYPWIFQDYLSSDLDGYIGSLEYQAGGHLLQPDKRDPWMISMWISGCQFHDEEGILWNTFDPTRVAQDNLQASAMYMGMDRLGFERTLTLFARFTIKNEDGLGRSVQPQVTFPGLEASPPDCTWVSLQYQTTTVSGVVVPRIVLTARWLIGGVTYQSRDEVEIEPDPEFFPGSEWTWEEPLDSRAMVGALYPPRDQVATADYYSKNPSWWDNWPGGPYAGFGNFPNWKGCMNNLAIYRKWIEPDTYDYEAIWNGGQGLLAASQPYEYWCPPNDPWSDDEFQTGRIAGIQLANTGYMPP